ncbi:MAG: S46 family peptidase [Gammaproteobacteria bacterium]|nr:S46 family peptidase [Gammaproteobacteria bacterium]
MRLTPVYAVLFFVAAVARADEGMWTYDNLPAEAVRQRHGVKLDQPWLDRARLSTVRLEGGCTGSFASPDGLVLTNHHCVADCLARLSTPERDLQAAGFLARSRAEEQRCAAEQVSVLERLEDVTAQVLAAVGDATSAESNEKRKATLTGLEQACEDSYQKQKDPHSCEAVTLYGGGQYFLYHYRRYDDVRLVFAPETRVAFFGGDVDNFEFPRWNLDMSLLRAYRDGRPARTRNFLRWRRAGADVGEAVFVSGHPGSTQRLDTVSQLKFERELTQAHWLLRYSELRGRYLQYATGGEEAARQVHEPLFSMENSYKVFRNRQGVLLSDAFMTRREGEEAALRAAVAADATLAPYARAWQDVDDALGRWRPFFYQHNFIERGGALQGDFAFTARQLVRAAHERPLPNTSRQREFTDAALPQMRQQLLAPIQDYRDLETLRLTFSLEKLVEYLGIDDPLVRSVLGRDSPRTVATRVIAGTRIVDPAFREKLWDGGLEAVRNSDDPLIQLVLRIEPEARALRKRYEDEVEAVLAGAGERLARARFAIQGDAAYPDATFTLRLSYGAVTGWREGDREVTPFTDLGGLFGRATGQAPFALPARWLDLQAKLDPATRLNFTTDNDITGGNSGSPMLDSRGRLIGLIFDGNRHSIGGDYWFDPALNRAIAVHPAAMLAALEIVYGAGHIVRELAVE